MTGPPTGVADVLARAGDGAPPATLAALFRRADRPRGAVLQRQGDPVRRVAVVGRGAVRATRSAPDGSERVAWFAFEGDVVGSLGALDGGGAAETLEVVEDATLAEADAEAVRALVGRDAAATAYLLAAVTAHARAVEEEAHALRSLPAAERYRLLLEREPALFQRVRVQDVASYLGVARETLSRLRGGGRGL